MDINALHKMCTWPMQSHSVAAMIIPLVYHIISPIKLPWLAVSPIFRQVHLVQCTPFWLGVTVAKSRFVWDTQMQCLHGETGNRTQSTQLRTVVLLAALTLYKLQRKIRKPPNICQAAQRWSKSTSKACWPWCWGRRNHHGISRWCEGLLIFFGSPYLSFKLC